MGKIFLYVRPSETRRGDFNADFNADFRKGFAYALPVDMGDDELIIYNYTLNDLNNPTIVRNSYSCTATLPRTRRNNKVFGNFFRSDRVTGNGFDASRKTPFVIYDEKGAILESGYLSLDAVTRDGYEVTLYGGLGSFFHNLATDSEGNARTMASLTYLPRRTYPNDIDFTINAENVQEAWTRLRTGSGGHSRWAVINFAPCYNGISDDFDHDKILIKTSAFNNIPNSGGGKSPRNGYALATLDAPVNEWIVRDLRSYKQRPVLSVAKALDAISDPTNNGGWSVNWHGDFAFTRSSWVTLPMLSANNKYTRSSVITNGWRIRNQYTEIQNSNQIEIFSRSFSMSPFRTSSGSAEVSATIRVNPRIENTATLYDCDSKVYRISLFQVIGYRSNGEIAAASNVYAVTNNYFPASVLDGYITRHITPIAGRITNETRNINRFYSAPDPAVTKILGHYENGKFKADAGGYDYVDIPISGYGIDSYEVRYKVVYGNVGTAQYGLTASHLGITCVSNLTASSSSWVETARFTDWQLINETIQYTAIRSGAEVTKADILTTDYSPADFLISLARLNGWYFVVSQDSKSVDIYDRATFYTGEAVDLSRRVDMSTAEVTPIAAESKFYDFAYPESYGGLTSEYEARTGRKYASIRVNTGYEFDDEPIEQFGGLIFKGAAMLTDYDKQYCNFRAADNVQYFGWQMKPVTYTFGDKATGTAEYTDPGKTPASITPFNRKGEANVDAISKICLFDKDGKGEAGDGVLLYYDSRFLYGGASYQISDDTAEMFYQNEGKPCYILNNDSISIIPQNVPFFRRGMIENYAYNPDAKISTSWDIQAPTEVYDYNFPNVDVNGGVYARQWRDMISDRYNKDTRVVKVKTNLSKLAISYESFRKFYYFDGAVWVLNNVKDYALNSDDLATCEFIKVNDIANY